MADLQLFVTPAELAAIVHDFMGWRSLTGIMLDPEDCQFYNVIRRDLKPMDQLQAAHKIYLLPDDAPFLAELHDFWEQNVNLTAL